MPIQYESNPDRFRGQGLLSSRGSPMTVTTSGTGSFSHAPASAIEEMPRTGSLEAAIEWGRKQTPRAPTSSGEEANATRSLLNTAKLIEQSAVLMRLKELEALEKVTEKIDKLTVFGGLDGVLKQLVTLKT